MKGAFIASVAATNARSVAVFVVVMLAVGAWSLWTEYRKDVRAGY